MAFLRLHKTFTTDRGRPYTLSPFVIPPGAPKSSQPIGDDPNLCMALNLTNNFVRYYSIYIYTVYIIIFCHIIGDKHPSHQLNDVIWPGFKMWSMQKTVKQNNKHQQTCLLQSALCTCYPFFVGGISICFTYTKIGTVNINPLVHRKIMENPWFYWFLVVSGSFCLQPISWSVLSESSFVQPLTCEGDDFDRRSGRMTGPSHLIFIWRWSPKNVKGIPNWSSTNWILTGLFFVGNGEDRCGDRLW